MSTGEVCWDLIGSCNKCLLRPQLERSVFDDSAFCHTRCSSTKKTATVLHNFVSIQPLSTLHLASAKALDISELLRSQWFAHLFAQGKLRSIRTYPEFLCNFIASWCEAYSEAFACGIQEPQHLIRMLPSFVELHTRIAVTAFSGFLVFCHNRHNTHVKSFLTCRWCHDIQA